MWHRMRPTGRLEGGMVSLSLDSELVRAGDAWTITDGGRTLAAFPRQRLRVSVSWKALVFDRDAGQRRCDDRSDDVDLDEVLRRFTADLRARGQAVDPPADPLRDPDFIGLLQWTYVHPPAS